MTDPAGSIEESVAAELAAALTAAGLPAGACLLVHSGILPVMNEFRRRGLRDRDLRTRACMCFDRALQMALGAQGTVCVPGFFYDYARHGLTFDARTAQPDISLGAYPPYFLAHRMEHRSLNPLANLMIAGPKAEKIAAVPSVYGNGVGSPWFQLVEEDGWVLFFGASPRTITFAHHVEHLVGVPHLYNKLYRVPIVDLAGRRYDRSFCSVRFLDRRFAIVYQPDEFLQSARELGILVAGQWQGAPIHLARLQPTQAYLTAKLIEDPYFLLKTKPDFAREELPDDGPSPVDDAVR